ncbi:MAG: hypothetical protein D6731_23425 [Planctomycetota bacterium]|nr:MAG: hypothetical protein D6731_23425 [Planctomycetota bacterium]
MARSFAPAAFCAALCLTLSGCLDYREQIRLEPDGSGTMVVDFLVDLGLMNEVAKAFGDEPDPAAQKGPTREEILQGLKVDGIRVDALDVRHKGDLTKVHIELHFDSLEKLSLIQGFGDDRKMEFFDNGDGRVRVVYSFDTRDVIPLEELGEEPANGQELDPIEKKVLEITARARQRLRFRARVEFPGPILKSNGGPDTRKPPSPNARVWRIDAKSDPRRHARLGRGKIVMQLLVDRSTVPWVKTLQPLPGKARPPARGAGKDRAPGGMPPRGLGD